MRSAIKIFVLVLIGLLIGPFTILVKNAETVNTNNSEISDDPPITEVDSEGRRSHSFSRSNFQITSTTPVFMPQVDASWTQDDWSGGSGQLQLTNSTKYNNSVKLNDTENSILKLGFGDDVPRWKPLADSPVDRARHRFVWNPTREVFYLFGGESGSFTYSNELYEYDPSKNSWRQIGQTNPPPSRCAQVMVYDTINDLLWVHGGRQGWTVRYSDIWSYNPATDVWQERFPGPGPVARCDHAGVFDPVNENIIIWGGYSGDWNNVEASVFIYNITDNSWWRQNNYTKRYFHDAIWSAKTNSALFYGGADWYQAGSGHDLVDEFNEYFPENDTWTNRSTVDARIYPILAWDSADERFILHGGQNPSTVNDTYFYDLDTDTWVRTLDIPGNRYTYDGDWDDKNNQFVIYGGNTGASLQTKTYSFKPRHPAYNLTGELTSSVFNPGHRINPKTVSFELANPTAPKLGSRPVKIKLAGSEASPAEANAFIGPNGQGNTYFYQGTGQAAPSTLKGSKYIAYIVNLSTENNFYSPRLNWIKIDYFTYPGEYTFTSPIDTTNTDELPLRHINWTTYEPEGTSIDIYFRQSYFNDLLSRSWEKVDRGQTVFGYRGGSFFQYKAVLKTGEPGYTPELSTITFTFNQRPAKPDLTSPVNDSWLGDPNPSFTWKFSDPDGGDYQSNMEIEIGKDESFSSIVYKSNTDEVSNASYTIDSDLLDGKYFWRLRLCDNYGSWSNFSDTSTFKIDTAKPELPAIESFSHQIETKWYNHNKPGFHWLKPYDISGIAGYSYIMDQSPFSEPDNNITMTDEEYNLIFNASNVKEIVSYDSIPDGIWYFHLKSVDSHDTWSDTATRAVRVDTTTPAAVNKTPKKAIPGNEISFSFDLNDSGSGVDLITLYWKYSSDQEFQYFDFPKGSDGNISMKHKVKISPDPYIEYFLEATDKSEPVNTLRYPASGYALIELVDKEPPVIFNVTGSKTHNKFIDLEITVKATDNIGLRAAKIYVNDQGDGFNMNKESADTFTISFNRVEMLDLAGYAGENIIIYKIKVWDYRNNTDITPDTGNHQITLVEEEDTGGTTKKPVEEGFLQSFGIYAVVIIVMIVIVALFLFLFVKKQKKIISDDRHKMRMAVTDAEERAALSSAQQLPVPQDLSQLPSVASPTEPTGYLPPAYDQSQVDAGMVQQETDVTAMEQVGLQTPTEPEVTQQTPVPGKTERKDVIKDGPIKEDKKVKIDKDVFISLPGEDK